MTFLFNDHHVLVVPCTPLPDTTNLTADLVSIGENLYRTPPGQGRLGLRITSATRSEGPSLICWAQPDIKTDGVSVPSGWLTQHNHIFTKSASGIYNVSISVVEPALITEVFLTALSPDALQFSRAHIGDLETSLTQNSMILRQSTTYTMPAVIVESSGWSERKILQYRLNMVSPVAQGYAEKGLTRFIVAFSGALPAEHNTTTSSDSDNESDSEGIEIDEGFLAVGSSNPHSSTLDPLFQARPLPEVHGEHPGDHVLYLNVFDFGRVGLLNGDWGIIHANDVSRRRLVCVYTDPSDSCPTGIITGAPMLLCNISEGFDYSTKSFSLLTSPFGSLEPNIPIARSATIARVATPISTDRSYQTLFLHALKQYFEGKKRLVKEGDLIALEIDTDLSWRIADPQKTEVSSPDDDEPSSTYPCTLPRANEVVFFMITHIEHPAVTNGFDTHDIAYESAAGELGFWIDPTVTRIVQTGLEHTRIPDIGPSTSGDRDPRSLLATISKQHSALLSVGSPFDQLRSLLSATFADFAVDYNLDLSVLLQGARGTGKSTVACWVAQRLGFNILEINCYNLLGENDTKTEGVLRTRFEKAIQCAPCILFLKHVDALAQTTQVLETGKDPAIVTALKECMGQAQGSWRTTNFPVVVLGTTSEPSKVPGSILALFKHQISFEAPNEAERYEILNALLDGAMLAPDVSLASIATQTAALVASDLASLVARARHVSLENVPNITPSADQSNIPLTASDFDVALNKARASYSDAIGAPRIPTVTWDDVGGLAHVKSDILDTIQLPLEHPELFADGLKKRSGILLYGPPGTGKTLLAKAVATSCSLNFFSVKGPELLNMYIGESEANVRRVFQRARDARPCVIFFDELDSVAPKRGNHGDSGGVMDRIVSQLLAELDGMSSGKGGSDVFVIGATNRPDLLDPALLRPGRFDRMLYLGVSDTHEAQSNILEALTRKFRLHPDLNLKEVAERCPFNYTGADFYALCSDAMLGAMSRKAEELEAVISKLNEAPGPHSHPFPLTPQYYLAEMATPEEIDVLVTKEDFDIALKNLVPSVSQSEMEHYARVQQRFSQKSDD